MTDKKGDKPESGEGPQDPSKRRFLKAVGTGAVVAATGGTKVPVQVVTAATPVIKEAVEKGIKELLKGLIPKGLAKILGQIDSYFVPDGLVRAFSKGEYSLDNLEKIFKTKELPKGKYGLPDLKYLDLFTQALTDCFVNRSFYVTGINELTIKDFFSKEVFDYFEDGYVYEDDEGNYNYENDDGEPVLIPRRSKEEIETSLQMIFKRFLDITGAKETDRISDIKQKFAEKKIAFYEAYLSAAEEIFIEGLYDKEEVKYLYNDLVSLGRNDQHSDYLGDERRRVPYWYLKNLSGIRQWAAPFLRENDGYVNGDIYEGYSDRICEIVKRLDIKLYELETTEREKWEKEQQEKEEKEQRDYEEKAGKEKRQRKEKEREKRQEENENLKSREIFNCSVKEIREEGWFSGLDTTFVISREGWQPKQSFKIVDVRKYFDQILSENYTKKVSGGYGESLETYKNGFLMRYLSGRNKEIIKVVTSNLEVIKFLRQKIKENVYLEIPNRSYEDPNRQDTDEELEEILNQNTRRDE
jgi:hypothetical protein